MREQVKNQSTVYNQSEGGTMENYIYIAQVVSVWGKICLAACVHWHTKDIRNDLQDGGVR